MATFNVLVEMESQIVVVNAESESDAINIAMDAAMHNLQMYGSVIQSAD